jgi:hypothetical protein
MPSLHYRGHAIPGQALPGLPTSMTGVLIADGVETVCSPCGDSSGLATTERPDIAPDLGTPDLGTSSSALRATMCCKI